MKDDPQSLIFTENIDYSKTGNTSIWGDGDPETLEVLQKLVDDNKISGKWLHFAAGDGRYNSILLNQVDKLIATDIDITALKKLQKNTTEYLAKKLILKEQDITNKFPFSENTFNGVFNTGTLHLFPISVIESIFFEVFRILKNDGVFIFDFATDITRVKSNGTLVSWSKNEYNKLQAKELLTKLLISNQFKFQFYECNVVPEEVTSTDGTYMFSCNYWLVVAYKNISRK